MGEPEPVAALNKRAAKAVKDTTRALRVQVGGALALILLLGAAVGVLIGRGNSQQSTIQSQQKTITFLLGRAGTEQSRIEQDIAKVTSGSCQFYKVIGTLPVVVTSTASTPRTSILGYNLIEGARTAYLSFSCPVAGLGKPSAGLKALARLYHESPPK